MAARGSCQSIVDTNVLSDVLRHDPAWHDWSSQQLERLQPEGLAINPVILAEIAAIFDSLKQLNELLPARWLTRLALPWEAAFTTSRAFLLYRRSGGTKTSPMPDFYIGAHAQVSGLRLLTRDATRYRTYFPEIELIAPN